jgi:chemotaxis protein MotB
MPAHPPATPSRTQPIIIKRKAAHHGHHGGAWKVAYADFVTALMSLFIVLWLTAQSSKIKEAVAGYFNDPHGTSAQLGTTMMGTGIPAPVPVTDLNALKDRLIQEIKASKNLEKLSRQIEITVTQEGLRIELLEGSNATFYESGSAHLSDNGQQLLALLASELKTLPNHLLIEGHTDAAQYSPNADYTNWELSADRANSARRLMQQDGVRGDQVTQVRGYADQMLRVQSNPYDPSNRRVTILVKNEPGAPARLPGSSTPKPQQASQSAKKSEPSALASNAAVKPPAVSPASQTSKKTNQ